MKEIQRQKDKWNPPGALSLLVGLCLCTTPDLNAKSLEIAKPLEDKTPVRIHVPVTRKPWDPKETPKKKKHKLPSFYEVPFSVKVEEETLPSLLVKKVKAEKAPLSEIQEDPFKEEAPPIQKTFIASSSDFRLVLSKDLKTQKILSTKKNFSQDVSIYDHPWFNPHQLKRELLKAIPKQTDNPDEEAIVDHLIFLPKEGLITLLKTFLKEETLKKISAHLHEISPKATKKGELPLMISNMDTQEVLTIPSGPNKRFQVIFEFELYWKRQNEIKNPSDLANLDR